MKNALKIVIKRDGATICHPRDNALDKFIYHQDGPFVDRLAEFCSEAGLSVSSVILFISEDQLFVKFFQLPLKTPDIKEAINFQSGLLTPFSNDTILYSYKTVRQKDCYRVTMFSARPKPIDSYLVELIESGYKILGLYPENQSYVTRFNRKLKWALVIPGRFPKTYIFDGIKLEDRFINNQEPDFSELATICGTETIYHLSPPDGSCFLDAGSLNLKKPVLKGFNMLPESKRQPDYSKPIIMVLFIINIIALLAVAGLTEFHLHDRESRVDEAINRIMPQVKEVKGLRDKNERLKDYIEKIEGISPSPDIITFLAELTTKLPETSYLDQMRMDKKKNAIHIQGYTEDISDLTSKLKEMGETSLKSTSRRRNKTYFNVEISLP